VSAGFDAAEGDPIGGCAVTPECFGHMTALLQPVAPLVVLLEGGYNLLATALGVEACLRVLLGDRVPPLPAPAGRAPTAAGTLAVQEALAVQVRLPCTAHPRAGGAQLVPCCAVLDVWDVWQPAALGPCCSATPGVAAATLEPMHADMGARACCPALAASSQD
jgi:Histone deacetylase domain